MLAVLLCSPFVSLWTLHQSTSTVNLLYKWAPPMVPPRNCAIFGCARTQHAVCSSLKRYGLTLLTDLSFTAPSFLNTYTVSFNSSESWYIHYSNTDPCQWSLARQWGGLHHEPALQSDHFHIGMTNIWLNWRMLDCCASQWNQSDIKTEVNISAVSPRVLYSNNTHFSCLKCILQRPG